MPLYNNKIKLKEAGLDLKDGANAKSILEMDRLKHRKGGHSSIQNMIRHKKIDSENSKILKALQ